MDSITYTLGKGGPGLLPLAIPAYRIHILVNGPGMLYSRLRLLTSLGLHDGLTFERLSALAGAFEAVALCGNRGTTEIPISVVSSRIGARLELGCGPASMYQSELVIRTRTDLPFDETFRVVLGARAEGALFALEPIAETADHGGSAHGEHGGHGGGGPHHDHGHHGHGG